MKSAREYFSGLSNIFVKYKYVFIVAAVGVILLAWPTGEKPDAPAAETVEMSADVSAAESELTRILALADGVGRVEVMLSLESDMEYVYADEYSRSYDEKGADAPSTSVEENMSYKTVRQSDGSEAPVMLTRVYPKYKGAVVVCDGAESAGVRLMVVKAVCTLTGLTTDRVSVVKMK
jgi:stage III sporulation protein AG